MRFKLKSIVFTATIIFLPMAAQASICKKADGVASIQLQKAAACVVWGPDGIASSDRGLGHPYGEKARTIEEARVECEKALPIAIRSGLSRADLERIHDPTISRIYYMCPDQKMIVHIIPEQFEEGLFNRTYQQLPGGKLLKGGFLGPPPPP